MSARTPSAPRTSRTSRTARFAAVALALGLLSGGVAVGAHAQDRPGDRDHVTARDKWPGHASVLAGTWPGGRRTTH